MAGSKDATGGSENERQAIALLKAVVETVVDGILTIDQNGTIITANPAVERIFGYGLDELYGKNVRLLMPSPYHEEHDDYLRNYRKTGDRKIIGIGREVHGRRKDGAVFPIYLAVGETITESGPIFTGIVRDITERIQREEELKRERGLLKAVVETAVDGIITIDEEGTIITANPATTAMFGYSSGELIGNNVRMLMPEPYHGEHDGYLHAYRTTGKKKIIGIGREVEGKRKNGEVFPLELAVSETLTDLGRVFTGILRDVTERKRAQAAMFAKETAERANAAKSEFLSRMSHELRTPLNAVLGFAQLLEMRYEDPRIREASDAISKAGNHLLQLINEILDISRIESGSLTLSIEPVEVAEAVAHAVDLVAPLASRADVKLLTESASLQGATVRADRKRLIQVLINIVSNAVKYNRKGGQVFVSGSEAADGLFRLDIADTGPGISLENRASLFQPFVRFGDQSIEGSGLGLVVSQRFAELMSGRIELKDSSDRGSTFSIFLPKATAEELASVERVSAGLGDKPHFSGETKVLYIEDNLSNYRLLELAFQDWGGITLIAAVQGEIGIELAQAHAPDLILLDLHLPDISGEEVLRRLKSNPETRDIPVVVVSADAMSRQVKRLLSAGAVDYLTKPLDLRKLGTVMRGILGKGSS